MQTYNDCLVIFKERVRVGEPNLADYAHRRVINLAISCTITSLLILGAALLLGLVGVLYRQVVTITITITISSLLILASVSLGLVVGFYWLTGWPQSPEEVNEIGASFPGL